MDTLATQFQAFPTRTDQQGILEKHRIGIAGLQYGGEGESDLLEVLPLLGTPWLFR